MSGKTVLLPFISSLSHFHRRNTHKASAGVAADTESVCISCVAREHPKTSICEDDCLSLCCFQNTVSHSQRTPCVHYCDASGFGKKSLFDALQMKSGFLSGQMVCPHRQGVPLLSGPLTSTPALSSLHRERVTQPKSNLVQLSLDVWRNWLAVEERCKVIVINENKCVRYNTEESLCICYVTVKTLSQT